MLMSTTRRPSQHSKIEYPYSHWWSMRRVYPYVLALLIALLGLGSIRAQEAPNCRNLNVSVDLDGNTYFTLEDIITNYGVASPALVTIKRNEFETPVFGPISVSNDPIIFNACRLLDETLKVYVENVDGTCWSNLTFKQLDGPQIPSRNQTIYCFDTLVHGPDLSNPPIAQSPCQEDQEAHFVTDWLINYECDPGVQDTVKVILREWEAYDKFGRRGVSFDTIAVLQMPEVDADHIYCSDRDTVYCGDTTTVMGPFVTYEKIDGSCDTFRLIEIADVDDDGILEFNPSSLDPKCGFEVFVDFHHFENDCENIYRVTVNLKQNCYGAPDQTCTVVPSAGVASNFAEQIAPGKWRCEFWLHDLDTLSPFTFVKGNALFEDPFTLSAWDIIANPLEDTVANTSFFDPEQTIDLRASPYKLVINSHKQEAAPASPENVQAAGVNVFLQNAKLTYIASQYRHFDFGWFFDLNDLPLANASLSFTMEINGELFPIIEENDELPPSGPAVSQPATAGETFFITSDKQGILSVPLTPGDVLVLRAYWTSTAEAALILTRPNIVSTSEHECAAHTYVPPLDARDDWSGVKQVKAQVDNFGSFTLQYNSQDSCWESHERVKLPKNGNSYKVIYQIYDSCHNVSLDSTMIYLKDRIKPVAVMDKTISVSLNGKKTWLQSSAFDEGSWDNCGLNMVLVRRSDWKESCVDLCNSLEVCHVGEHNDTLWQANLDPENEVEDHFIKTLDWLCEDDSPCGDLLYNAWIYSLMKYSTLDCIKHPYRMTEENFRQRFIDAYFSSSDFRSKFEQCSSEEEARETTADIFDPFALDLGNVADLYDQIGGGWSTAVPFDCTDACSEVTVELLVIDYWCNWSRVWDKVWVEDKNPPQVVRDVVDGDITCKSYRDKKYSYPGSIHPVSIEFLVEKAKENDPGAMQGLDQIFGGYSKVWVNDYNQYVDTSGKVIPETIPFYDSLCHCALVPDQVYKYDEHLGYFWKDTLTGVCGYLPDTAFFAQGAVKVNCVENVQCEQEIWCDFDLCGSGVIYRKFKIWQGCDDSSYIDSLLPDSLKHDVDTIVRHQRIHVNNSCELDKHMFDIPVDTTVEVCGIDYDGLGNVIGDAGPGNTGKARYRFDDDCRQVGIAYQDKVFKIVGGEEACYKIERRWYFADWCINGVSTDPNWHHSKDLVIDSAVQVIRAIDRQAPVCQILGPVLDGDTVEMPGCLYDLGVTVEALDVCGLTDYSWELKNITDLDDVFLHGSGNGMLMRTEESFRITSSGLPAGDYFLKVEITDECNNESICEYHFSVKAVSKPQTICLSSLTVKLTPWDSDQDGIADTSKAIVWASELDQSSRPNCGDDSVGYRLELLSSGSMGTGSPPEDDFIELGCADVGTRSARLWVISLPSNVYDYCDVILVIKSEGGDCMHSQAGAHPLNEVDGHRIKKYGETEIESETEQNISAKWSRSSDFIISTPNYIKNAEGYQLKQNVPNPFDHETSISFVIPMQQVVRITFFDVSGKIIYEHKNLYDAGTHMISISRDQIRSSPVIFYRIQAGEYSDIKRMILIE